MPQLDTVSFFIQIISVFLVYTFFFVIILFKFLPNITLIIKTRKKWLKTTLNNRYNITNKIINKIIILNSNLLKKGKYFLTISINILKLKNV
jgi:hypothetical protein